MDIRSYFPRLGNSSSSKKESSSKEKKRKKAIIESDDEDPLPSNKKIICLASDSDDDIFERSPQLRKVTKSKGSHFNNLRSAAKSKSPSKLRSSTANDFFGSATVHQSRKSKTPIKEPTKKVKTPNKEVHSDDEFEKTLAQFDEVQRIEEKVSKKETKESSKTSHALSAKLATKVRGADCDTKVRPTKKIKTEENNDFPHKTSQSLNDAKKLEKLSSSKKKETLSKDVPLNADNTKESSKLKKIKEEPKSLSSMSKSDEVNSKACNGNSSHKTPIKIEKKNRHEDISHTKNDSHVPESLDKSINEESLMTPENKMKQNAAAYHKYLHREGPANLGSKAIPEGSPGCFSGLTFVITGVLDSLDREDITEIIKKYSGKVTTSISKNTKYVVAGQDAGPAKLKKAEQIGTSIISEDDFLQLIASSSQKAPDSSTDVTPSKRHKETPSKTQKESSSRKIVSKVPVKASTSSSDCSSSCSSLSQTSFSSNCSKKSVASTPTSSSTSESQLWVDKYQPSSLKNIIGQQGDSSNAKKLLKWLKNWTNSRSNSKITKPSPWSKSNDGSYYRAALLSGPPGVGKTTTAYLTCKEVGFDTVEMNASVTRSKRSLKEEVAELLSNQSLKGFSAGSSNFMTRNHVLLMDEVDGMAGNEDRGGVQELILLIKNSKIPIICMCNDRNHPKIRSLANYCYDLRFQKPRIEQIRGAMMSVCFKEGIKMKSDALDQMIMGAKHDIRQVLHHLSVWSADQKNLDADQVKKEAASSKKDFKMGPWDVCQKVFNQSEHKNMSIHDKVGLFFNDYSIGPLFVQQNYLRVSPHCARGNPKMLLEQIQKTANVLADGDLVEHAIRKNNAWSLLPVQALFSSVCPGEYMSGHFNAQIEFPQWLGNHSRAKKCDRLAQELQMHMRLRVSGSKLAVATDYSSKLKNKILKPLLKHGAEGIEEAVSVMTSHDLLREDLESIIELSKWPFTKDLMLQIQSKVKAAFTRALNKDSHLNPYSTATISKSRRNATMNNDMEGEEINEESDEDDDNDINKDGMIIQGKKGGQSSKASLASSNPKKGKGAKRK